MRLIAALLATLMLGACTPLMVQQAGQPPMGFQGARLDPDAFVSFDGSRLGLTQWEAQGPPKAVLIGVHGMNDYARAFALAAPYWAQNGVTTYAYDQRGFGQYRHHWCTRYGHFRRQRPPCHFGRCPKPV